MKAAKAMNTFLPYADFTSSARVLDPRRLGKQRVEARQIYFTLIGRSTGWRHHPAVRMWRGCEDALLRYGDAMITEWVRRGFRNTMALLVTPDTRVHTPSWLGDPRFHAAHRSNLLRKDPIWYARYNWAVPHNLPYIWPRSHEEP